MANKYDITDFSRFALDFLHKRYKIIKESFKDSKFIFCLQCFNFVLIVYLLYTFTSLVNSFVDLGGLKDFLTAVLALFGFFVITIIVNLLGKGISSMIIFQMKLNGTLATMLLLLLILLGFQTSENKLKYNDGKIR